MCGDKKNVILKHSVLLKLISCRIIYWHCSTARTVVCYYRGNKNNSLKNKNIN